MKLPRRNAAEAVRQVLTAGAVAASFVASSAIAQLGDDHELLWAPHAKQAELLAAPDFEVLYGGAAGAGKTDALLMDATGHHQNALDHADYQAILFRKTFPDLKDMIARSQELYPALGGKYDKQAHVWTFPSGARIELGYLQYDADRFKYRGRAFQYIGWDELTLWASAEPYRYLLSRCRTTNPAIKCYVRGTTNPDGPGFRWVKEWWRIETEGTSTRFKVELQDPETGEISFTARRFISARLSDNPHLATTGYRQTLLLLSAEEQRALLMGRWESPSIKGAYYGAQIEAARSEGRICKIPSLPAVPVNTFWDLGWNDTTAIWLHQRVGLEHRFIDYIEANGKDLEYFVQELQSRSHIFGTHYLPHDAESATLASGGKSVVDLLRKMLPDQRFEVVDRVSNVVSGINQTRSVIPACYFDEERCRDGVSALESYRKEYDDRLQAYKPTPLHDWASNGSDAFRQFAQGYEEIYRGAPRPKSWRDRLTASYQSKGSAQAA